MPKKREGGPLPTKMGERILLFLQANGVSNYAQFAESVIGISRQTFHAWLYKPINPEKIAARPLLLCAEALSTNPEYLLCISDDPRPETALSLDEHTLVNAFRALSETDQGRLLKMAADWTSITEERPSAMAPFRVPMPTRRS